MTQDSSTAKPEQSYLDLPGANAENSPNSETSNTNELDAKQSESSPDGGAKEPEAKQTALDVVKSVMAESKKDGESPDTKKASEEQKAVDEKKSEADKKAEEDKAKDEPFHNHPRFKELTAERNEWKRKAEENQKVAEDHRVLREYLHTSNLGAEDFKTGLSIMRMMKNDPMAALEALAPIYGALQEICGAILPPDLQEKVNQGLIDEETAKEHARLRANAEINKTNESRRTQKQIEHDQRLQEQSEQEQVMEIAQKAADAVATWEENWKKSDPDYAKKQPLVTAKVYEIIARDGPPMTAEDAVKISSKAKDEVEKYLVAILPKPKGMQNVTGGSSGRNPQPKPTTSLEVARLAVRQT